ncbi:MAG: hypothetical protein QOK15_656 [Nocardioidaceae bacterium]|jgi:hypothetical protein|nr:hypothetical protein [Nocardioidaceae bacterium]
MRLAVPHHSYHVPLPFDLAGGAAMVTLLVMIVAAGTSDRTGRVGAGVLAIASVVWFFVNSPMEGSVLLTLSTDHGVTAADLAGLAGLAIAGWRWSLWRRSRPRR